MALFAAVIFYHDGGALSTPFSRAADTQKAHLFQKDLKLAERQGKNIDKLFDVVEKLSRGEKPEDKYRGHELSGNYVGCRERHIEPDRLLIYEMFGDVLVLLLARVGSYSDLFK